MVQRFVFIVKMDGCQVTSISFIINLTLNGSVMSESAVAALSTSAEGVVTD